MESIDRQPNFDADFEIKLYSDSSVKFDDENDKCDLLHDDNITIDNQHNTCSISSDWNLLNSYENSGENNNRTTLDDSFCSQKEIRHRIQNTEISSNTSPRQQSNAILKEQKNALRYTTPTLVSTTYPEINYIDYSIEHKDKSMPYSDKYNYISVTGNDVDHVNETCDLYLKPSLTLSPETDSRNFGGTFDNINTFLSSPLPSDVTYNLGEINTNDLHVKEVMNLSFSSLQSDLANHKIAKDASSRNVSAISLPVSGVEDKSFPCFNQCDTLKDIVTSEDISLQTSMDKYTKSDISHMESIVKSVPRHQKMCMDIDLLSDLDLEFLRVNGELGLGLDTLSRPKVNDSLCLNTRQDQNNRHIDPILIQQLPEQASENSCSNSINIVSPSHLIPPSCVYDEIGDLGFNLGCSDRLDSDDCMEFSHHNTFPESTPIIPVHSNIDSSHVQDYHCNHSQDTSIEGRFRANSLAFGGLLEEPNEEENQSIGKWMDRSPLLTQDSNINIQHIPQTFKRVTPPSILVDTLCDQDIGEDELVRNQDKTVARFEKRMVKWQSTRNGNRLPGQLEISSLRYGGNEENEKLPLIRDTIKSDSEKIEPRVKNSQDAREQTGQNTNKSSSMLKQKNEGKKKVRKNSSPKSVIREQYSRDHSKEIISEDIHKEVTSGTGRPRSLSDPNLLIGFDENGLMYVDGPPDWIGAYSPESRKIRIERFLAKRNHRVWVKKVKYDVRKNFADSRLRVKGRFVKKEDELLVRDLLSLT